MADLVLLREPFLSVIARSPADVFRPRADEFLFFAEDSKGSIVVDIVDPHSVAWADASAKLQGLASYAATHAHVFRRVEAVGEVKGKLRWLDLKRVNVRKAIEDAPKLGDLYEGEGFG